MMGSSTQLPRRPCQAHEHLPYCDTSLSRNERIQYLITHLTLEEKISLLGHDSPSINNPGVIYLPEYKWWNEALHGLAWTDCCPPYEWKNVTVFPQVIGLGMTWNRTLWNEIGGVIGTEALQKMHSTINSKAPHPGLTYFTPNINIFRDPRWGRGQETPGEDPYLTSHYAAIMVMSLQYGDQYLKQLLQEEMDSSSAADNHQQKKPHIAATCKHFAAYSLETNRLNFSAEIHDQRDWNDAYLPAFDACIHAGQFLHDYFGTAANMQVSIGGAVGVMCSYNAINQIPACANHAFLQDRLRQQWNFPGYVVSDCWAIASIYENHHYAKSYEEAVGMALRAGVDLDCGDTIQRHGMKAIKEGYIDVADIDNALTNLFGVLIDMGYFDDVEQASTNKSPVDGEDESQMHHHAELAFEAALQSIVLLKNEHGQPLPLSITKHRKINLIGPLANDENILLGNYHGAPSHIITPMQGLEDMGVEVNYVRGCNVTGGSDDLSDGSLCRQMISHSDATILIMGLNQSIEAEGIDRKTLLLPKAQRVVIESASHCSKARSPRAPVILVVMTGGPIDLSPYKSNNSIDAILYTSYPGQAGGKALAHTLYGRYNPSGRLVTTLYQNSFLNEVALEDMRMRPGPETLEGKEEY